MAIACRVHMSGPARCCCTGQGLTPANGETNGQGSRSPIYNCTQHQSPRAVTRRIPGRRCRRVICSRTPLRRQLSRALQFPVSSRSWPRLVTIRNNRTSAPCRFASMSFPLDDFAAASFALLGRELCAESAARLAVQTLRRSRQRFVLESPLRPCIDRRKFLHPRSQIPKPHR
jgi:hypothetical protein